MRKIQAFERWIHYTSLISVTQKSSAFRPIRYHSGTAVQRSPSDRWATRRWPHQRAVRKALFVARRTLPSPSFDGTLLSDAPFHNDGFSTYHA